MSLLRSAAFALPLTLTLALPVMAADPVTLDTEEQKLSYALGVFFGTNIAGAFPDLALDNALALEGVSGALGLSEGQMSPQDAQTTLQAYATKMQEAEKAAALALSKEKMEKAAAFMVENGAKEGIITTESGLQYKVVTEGEGDSPVLTDTVSVHYTGRLLDGTVFDSSVERGEPIEFPVTGVIKGWTEVLQLMKPGEKVQVWIPSDLAYGERGAGGSIGPNETLTFDIELLKVVK